MTLGAEKLHFRRAAQRLHIAQPALSQQIRQLEKELGIRLFHRNTRTVELSVAGREILPRVRQALDAVDGVRRMAAEIGVVLVWRKGNESPPVRAVIDIDIARRVLPTPEIES